MVFIALLTGCFSPLDGQLAAGVWGGEHWSLTVADDGSASLEGDCSHAELAGPLVATDGELTVEFDLVGEGGPVPDTGWGPGEPATLTAKVSATRLEGTVEVGGATEDIVVVLGDAPNLMKCL